MIELRFSLKTHKTEREAYSAFERAKNLLGDHKIPFKMDIFNQEFFITTDFVGKLEMSRVYKIVFYCESDLTAYQLIKD